MTSCLWKWADRAFLLGVLLPTPSQTSGCNETSFPVHNVTFSVKPDIRKMMPEGWKLYMIVVMVRLLRHRKGFLSFQHFNFLWVTHNCAEIQKSDIFKLEYCHQWYNLSSVWVIWVVMWIRLHCGCTQAFESLMLKEEHIVCFFYAGKLSCCLRRNASKNNFWTRLRTK